MYGKQLFGVCNPSNKTSSARQALAGQLLGGEAWLREPVSEEMFGRLPTATFQHPEGPVPCFFSNCSKANDLTSYQSRALYFSSPA